MVTMQKLRLESNLFPRVIINGSVHHMAMHIKPMEYASTTNNSKSTTSLLGQSAM
jgi:hypothetical protein